MSSCAPPRVTRSAATQLHHGLVLVLGPLLRAASCSWSRIPTTTRPRALNARTLRMRCYVLHHMALISVMIFGSMMMLVAPHLIITRTRWDEATPHSLALEASRSKTTRCGLSRDAAHAGGRGAGGGGCMIQARASAVHPHPPQRVRCSKNNNCCGLQSAPNKISPVSLTTHTFWHFEQEEKPLPTLLAVRHVQHVIWGVGGNDEREAP